MPDPMEYLPTTDEYPAEFLKPNPGRIELFKGLTFIFLDEEQYSNLVTPINAGFGKAVVLDPNGKTVDELVKFASEKGQVLLVQRNLKDVDDTFCIEASKRYILFKTLLMKAGLSSHHTKQSVGTGNASGPNATPETNRCYNTDITSSNSSTINS